MPNLTLYYSPGVSSLAPHILIHEAGLPFTATKIDIAGGFPASFRELNPKLRVPILAIDDVVITENPAIMLAISQLCPERHFMGSTDLERVRTAEWMNWLSGTMHGQAFGGFFKPARYVKDPSLQGAVKEKSLETLLDCLSIIEESLSGVHAVGNHLTIVDVFLYVMYRFSVRTDLQMATSYPKYTALVQNLYKLESVQATLQAEGVPSFVPEEK